MTRLMYDSVTAADIPRSASMVAGYVCGRYTWSAADWALFPRAIKVRICIDATHNHGDVLDVETGDATPAQAPAWWARRSMQGITPVLYVNRGNALQTVRAVTTQLGRYPLIWLSTLDGSRPWTAGVVAIQYAGSNLSGGHYDLSDVTDLWPGLVAGGGVELFPSQFFDTQLRQWFLLLYGRPIREAPLPTEAVSEFRNWRGLFVDDGHNMGEVFVSLFNEPEAAAYRARMASLGGAPSAKPSGTVDATITFK